MPHWRMAVVAAAVVVVAVAAGGTGPVTDGTIVLTSHGTPAAGNGFAVRARPVAGLFPGVVKPMAVTLRNPYGFDIEVTSLRGRVTESSKRSCRPGAKTVSARSYAGRLPVTVPAHSSREVGAVPIAMAVTAPERCRNTTFTVVVAGRATRARAAR